MHLRPFFSDGDSQAGRAHSCKEWGNVTGCLMPKSIAGIHIDGYDHFVSDSIVFSSQTGLLAEGAALLVQGVHVWNGIPAWNGTGIWLRPGGHSGNTRTRLIGCYLDFNDLVIEQLGPVEQLGSVVVSDGFFMGGAKIVIHLQEGLPDGALPGLLVVDNVFASVGRERENGDCVRNDATSLTHGIPCGSHDTVAQSGQIFSFGQVTIDRNLADGGYNDRVSRMTATQTSTLATEFVFKVNAPPNTPGRWLFPGVPVVHIQHSFSSATDSLASPMVARCGCLAAGVGTPRVVECGGRQMGSLGRALGGECSKNEVLAVLVQVKPGDPAVNGSVTLSVDQSCSDRSLC